MNSNYSIGMPTTAMGATIAGSSLSRQPMSQYEQVEHNNFNLSLNQILRVPYQIVMPPTEINQSISINNLPSLNDLAIRTGINTGMGTIFTQRSMAAPSPVPLTTQQLAVSSVSHLISPQSEMNSFYHKMLAHYPDLYYRYYLYLLYIQTVRKTTCSCPFRS
jgi:hypothetical protein